MASTAASAPSSATVERKDEVSLARLYVLRAAYALLVVGIGAMILPALVSHEPTARGVIPSLIGAVGLLAVIGLRYPLQMLPLLLFELTWKALWLVVFGLPQYLSGVAPPSFAEDFANILFGVVLMPIVIPWGYVWRHYVKAQGARWR